MKNSWEIMRGQWGLIKSMGISRSGIFRGKKNKRTENEKFMGDHERSMGIDKINGHL